LKLAPALPAGGEGEVADAGGEGGAEAIAADTVTLSQQAVQPALGGPPGSYEQNLATATAAVEQDPKLVAQVVKNWVKQDG